MKNFDNSFLKDDIKFIAGVDEAGRGPLAGPVVSASVIFDEYTYIDGVNDSKKLSQKERELLFPEILSKSLSYSVALVSHGKIDIINILQASLLSMQMAITRLKVRPDLILIDGNKVFYSQIPAVAIVKGDSKSFSIAAASIIAKVTRDHIMRRMDKYYPQYQWHKNKGYGTKDHINAIKTYGGSPFHRKSFLTKIISASEQNNLMSEE